MRSNLALQPADIASAAPPAKAWAEKLADVAVWALIQEAELTPKPALVDQRGSGVHADLSLEIMRRSAQALRPSFVAMALAAQGRAIDRSLREDLARIGRDAERTMMTATGGANAHRGAIWALGLLIAAVSMRPAADATEVSHRASAIARLPDRYIAAAPSNGQSVAARYGVPGARGEAQAGLPHALTIALPALRAARFAGRDEPHARLDALLAVMAVMDDTCLLHRGGRDALDAAKAGARDVLAVGGSGAPEGVRRLERLHIQLMMLNASPGGAADMLAAALFIDAVDLETFPLGPSPIPRS